MDTEILEALKAIASAVKGVQLGLLGVSGLLFTQLFMQMGKRK